MTGEDGREHLAYGNEIWKSSLNENYNQKLRLSSYLVERNLQISYCWIHKVASMSLQTIFMKLENNSKYLQEDKPYLTMYRMSPRSSKDFAEISSGFHNFLVVRHPFHRLVSAYRDRVEGCKMKGEWFMKVATKLGLSGDPTCYVDVDTGKIKLNKKANRLEISRKGVIVPTFNQFVEFLLDTPIDSFNPHWRPYYLHCSPCLGNWTTIVKLEETAEMNYLMEMTGLSRIFEQPILWRNKANRNTTESVAMTYFKSLQCDQVLGLVQLYSMDFVLFEYGAWQFVRRCKI